MKAIWYSVVDAHDDRIEFKISAATNLRRPTEHPQVAESCAHDFNHRHGGWEETWPLTFVVYETDKGPELFRYRVEREEEPVFYAYPLKKKGG